MKKKKKKKIFADDAKNKVQNFGIRDFVRGKLAIHSRGVSISIYDSRADRYAV